MRKKLFSILVISLLVAACFAITAFAADTELNTCTLSDIHTATQNAQDGDKIVVNLTGDLLIPNTSSAIVLDKDITLTINCNGYTIFANPGGGSAGTVYGMKLSSKGAKLILNGNSTVDYLNYEEPKDETITVSNGTINDPNEGTSVKSPDYASNGPAIVVFSGTIELNNMYLHQYNTGEWGIFFCASSGAGVEIEHNIIANNSIIRANNSKFCALGTRSGNSTVVKSLVQIENSVIYGTGNSDFLSMSAKSYIRNSRIAKYSLKVDSYIRDNYARDDNEAVIQNVIFENKSNYLYTGAIYLNVIDCSFPNGMEFHVNGDTQGSTRFTLIQSATCTQSGKQASVTVSKGGNKTITGFDDTDFAEVTETAAKGHTSDTANPTGVIYESYLSKGALISLCSVCRESVTEETPTAPAIFTYVGYSLKEDGNGITVGFNLDEAALELYNSFSDTELEFGFVAAVKSFVIGDTPLNNNGSTAETTRGQIIKVDVSNYNICKAYELKLSGTWNTTVDLDNDGVAETAMKDVELYMSGYIYDGTSVTYISDTATPSVPAVITYNTVK